MVRRINSRFWWACEVLRLDDGLTSFHYDFCTNFVEHLKLCAFINISTIQDGVIILK